MKIDQLAYYAKNESAAKQIKEHFGLLEAEWISDTVTGRVVLQDAPGTSVANLQFNYSLGIELEILTYVTGPHWHMKNADFIRSSHFMSHVGIHLEPDEPFPEPDAQLVQEMWTQKHTNPYLVEKKRLYHYRIYDTRLLLGNYTKYIKRIEYT